MASRPNQFQADIVMIRKLSQERNQNCLAFLIEGFFTGIFLFILDKNLVLLQLPIVIVFIILYLRPSVCKDLLVQQYLGLAAVGFNTIKTFFLIVNMTIYLIDFFGSSRNNSDASTPTKGILEVYIDGHYLFPNVAPSSSEASSFLGGVLIVIFGLIALFEVFSLYVATFIIRRTLRIIEKVKSLRIPQRSEADVNVQDVDNHNHREELASFRPLSQNLRGEP